MRIKEGLSKVNKVKSKHIIIIYELDVLAASIILISCVSVGLCGIIIARNRTGINKHSRQHIRDIQQDLNYLKESKNEEIKELRHDNLRLKGALNRMKAGPDFTAKELETGTGIGDLLLSKFGLGKYKKYLQPYLPQIEKGIIENKDEIINTLKSNNKSPKPGSEDQTINTL
tara:strand:- start:846 stop:1361 length:516 start_codon:yes stop_codon:yes gene_type:complete